MTLYYYIYNFLTTYLFDRGNAPLLYFNEYMKYYFNDKGNNAMANLLDNMPLTDILCHGITIIIMILFLIVMINLVVWCFKLGRHLLHL